MKGSYGFEVAMYNVVSVEVDESKRDVVQLAIVCQKPFERGMIWLTICSRLHWGCS